MLSLFRKRAAPEPAPPRTVPAGRRVYAVGDIHVRLDLLDDLIARIDADDAARDAGRTDWVFLGDLVDRGPDSAGVIERVIRLRSEEHTSELQSLMRISYAVFCLKKKTETTHTP